MFKVTYSYYGKYTHERQFNSYAAARKFFWVVQRRAGVTKAELN
jgi:hypothetical protein